MNKEKLIEFKKEIEGTIKYHEAIRMYNPATVQSTFAILHSNEKLLKLIEILESQPD